MPVCSHINRFYQRIESLPFMITISTASVKSQVTQWYAFFRYNAENLVPSNFFKCINIIRFMKIYVKKIFVFYFHFLMIFFKADPFNENVIKMEWQEKGSDFLWSYKFSDGTLRFICLTNLVYCTQKSIYHQ
jgi:hypothetical protein